MLKLSLITAFVAFVPYTYCGEVDEKFRSSKIVDELIPKPPDSLLDVEFDCGFTTLGNKFTPLQVRNIPKVTLKGAVESDLYTLIMVDVEVKKEWVHWVVGNIPGNNIDKGVTLVSFFPSAPPKNSGEHKYVFLLFKQPRKSDYQGQTKISTFQMTGRDEFSTKTFIDKYKLGTPVAGNFYLAAWDESCVEMYQLVEDYEKKLKN